jgi:hypothetical protein
VSGISGMEAAHTKGFMPISDWNSRGTWPFSISLIACGSAAR